jgi:hypothetical protein
MNRKVPLAYEIVDLLRAWLLEDNTSAESEGDEDVVSNSDTETPEDDPDARSLLWGYGGMSVIPGGAYPILHALVRHYLTLHDKVALAGLLQECLPRNLELSVWQHLLPMLRYVRPPEGADATSAITCHSICVGGAPRYPTFCPPRRPPRS